MMTDAHKKLLAWLRWSAKECPRSGALNAGKRPYYPNRSMAAIERRAEDGDQLVAYMRAKIHEKPKEGYKPLIDADRPDLTAEAVVLGDQAPWSTLFTDEDREAAKKRLALTGLTPEREDKMLARMRHEYEVLGLNAR